MTYSISCRAADMKFSQFSVTGVGLRRCDLLVFRHGACQLYRGPGLYDFSALFNMRRRQAECRLINEDVALYAKTAHMLAGGAVRVSDWVN